jgi:N-acetylglucosaminyldiphosphoundecaprenol N-acetyl-beta-D-mannosaminyltransferase
MNPSEINRVRDVLKRVTSVSSSALIELALSERGSIPTLVSTLNLQHLRHCANSEEFFRIYISSKIIVADGMPIIWLCKLFLGRKITRLTGVDICERLLCQDEPVFVLGSKRDTLSAALRSVSSLNDVPIYDEYFNPSINNSYLEMAKVHLRTSDPCFVILALGSPKQELLFRDLSNERLGISAVFFGLGGSLDILSGHKKRAPIYLQKIGMEWVWRLCQSPRYLFSRYLSDGKFLLKLIFARSDNGES